MTMVTIFSCTARGENASWGKGQRMGNALIHKLESRRGAMGAAKYGKP